jgi:hypothetical protein
MSALLRFLLHSGRADDLKRAMIRKDDGSPGRIRTSDMTVNSRPLYRLSYRGVFQKYFCYLRGIAKSSDGESTL